MWSEQGLGVFRERAQKLRVWTRLCGATRGCAVTRCVATDIDSWATPVWRQGVPLPRRGCDRRLTTCG